MKCPSAEHLTKHLKITISVAQMIRRIARSVEDPEKLRELIDTHCPKTAAYVRSMYSDPYDSHMWRVTVALDAINHLLDGDGVLGLGRGTSPDYAPPYEYINMGDTYSTTLIYRRRTDSLSIGCWGDIVERHRSRKSKRAALHRVTAGTPVVPSNLHAHCKYYGRCVANMINPSVRSCS